MTMLLLHFPRTATSPVSMHVQTCPAPQPVSCLFVTLGIHKSANTHAHSASGLVSPRVIRHLAMHCPTLHMALWHTVTAQQAFRGVSPSVILVMSWKVILHVLMEFGMDRLSVWLHFIPALHRTNLHQPEHRGIADHLWDKYALLHLGKAGPQHT